MLPGQIGCIIRCALGCWRIPHSFACSEHCYWEALRHLNQLTSKELQIWTSQISQLPCMWSKVRLPAWQEKSYRLYDRPDHFLYMTTKQTEVWRLSIHRGILEGHVTLVAWPGKFKDLLHHGLIIDSNRRRLLKLFRMYLRHFWGLHFFSAQPPNT